MRLLVLVDLDQDAPPPRPRAGAHTADVVLVCNTVTFDRWAPAALGPLAEAFAAADGAAVGSVRLALALPVPEAADRLIERLAAGLPGEWDAVRLHTEDAGLVRALRGFCGARGLAQPWPVRWARAPRPAPPAGGAEPLPPWRSVPIDAARCAAAASAPVQLGARWAPEIGRSPALLTEVGATESSLRGVERAFACLGGARPPLGAVGPGDGLVREQVGAAGVDAVEAIQPSSAGPGAVHALGAGPDGAHTEQTLPTRLPHWVLEQAHRSGAALTDRAALRALPEGRCVGPVVRVVFEGTGKLAIQRGWQASPATWWIAPGERGPVLAAWRRVPPDWLPPWLPRGFAVEGRSWRAGDRLVLASAHAGVARVSRDVPPRAIGLGVCGDRSVAVWGGWAGLPAGTHPLVPIQELAVPEIDGVRPADLPLLALPEGA